MVSFQLTDKPGFFQLAAVSLAVAGMIPAVLIPSAAMAQRDPAYSAARAGGQVGEKVDGYLGYVSPPPPALKAVIDELNIKRKAVYAGKAAAAKATVEEYALTSGCLLISQTVPGEKYQGPDGSWQTRTASPPLRDSRCPS